MSRAAKFVEVLLAIGVLASAGFVVFASAVAGQSLDPETNGSALVDFVELTDEGTIVVGQRASAIDHSEITAILETTGSGRWQIDPQVENVVWSLTAESCNPNDERVCVRLVPESGVDVSLDGGTTFTREWEVDDGGFWEPVGSEREGVGRPEFYRGTDIAWSGDGRAFIAMSDRYPIIRNVDGSFTPSIASLHQFPWATTGYMLLAWIVAAVGLGVVSRRKSTSGIVALGLSVGALLIGAIVFEATGDFGRLAGLVLLPVGLLLFVAGVVGTYRSSEPSASPESFARVSILKLIWPVLPIVAFGASWGDDSIGWITMLVLMVVVIGAGVVWAWPLRARQPRVS